MPELKSVDPWFPHPVAAPITERKGDFLTVAANGTRTCVGGWQSKFTGLVPGLAYTISCEVEHTGVSEPSDALHVAVFWGEVSPRQAGRDPLCRWDYVPLEVDVGGAWRASTTFIAPPGAEVATVRYTFRWSTCGTAQWHVPRIVPANPPATRPSRLRVSVVTGTEADAREGRGSLSENVTWIAERCEDACQAGAALVVLPEAALQWAVIEPRSPLDMAVTLDSPEVQRIRDVARRHRSRIILGLWERDSDAVFNSAALISPDGAIDGVYRKTHLAVAGENESGVLPGASIPVFQTELGRIGCTICVDNSTLETSRVAGVRGAQILAIPIAGDNRCDSSGDIGPSVFDEDRWRAIMRTRAMDNHLVALVARNNSRGSCIVNPRGDIVAWNDGRRDRIDSNIDVQSDDRAWNGGSLRDIQWMQRRPHLYGRLVDRLHVDPHCAEGQCDTKD